MSDWSTVAQLATAAGTLVLALATFVAVRAANRAARVSEYSMQIGIRPLLMPSRLTDPEQKIMWGDEHWAKLGGSGAVLEEVGDVLYLAMSLRNSGSGIAVIQGWYLLPEDYRDLSSHADPDAFTPQQRDLYVPGDDVGFWQAAVRDPTHSLYTKLAEAIQAENIVGVEILYSDNEGGQRAIGRFAVAPFGDNRWHCSVVKHWNLDRPDPR